MGLAYDPKRDLLDQVLANAYDRWCRYGEDSHDDIGARAAASAARSYGATALAVQEAQPAYREDDPLLCEIAAGRQPTTVHPAAFTSSRPEPAPARRQSFRNRKLIAYGSAMFVAAVLALIAFWSYRTPQPSQADAGFAPDSTSSAPERPVPSSATPGRAKSISAREVLPALGPALMSSIEHLSTANSTTVVLKMSHAEHYSAHRLIAPDRIYFDFSGTQVTRELNGKELSISDPLVRKIRSAQRSPDISRVTIETAGTCDYSVSFTHNPDRLLIELRSRKCQRFQWSLWKYRDSAAPTGS